MHPIIYQIVDGLVLALIGCQAIVIAMKKLLLISINDITDNEDQEQSNTCTWLINLKITTCRLAWISVNQEPTDLIGHSYQIFYIILRSSLMLSFTESWWTYELGPPSI